MLPAFGWQAVLEQWQFAPVVTALAAILAALYVWGAWRVARRHPARPWPWWRAAFFFAGLAVIVLATESGIGNYDDVLFWDHMVQHLMLIMVAPPLLVAGQPVTLLLHASRNPLHAWTKRVIRSRVVTFLTWPPFTLVAYAAVIVSTHLTGLITLTITHPVLHDAEHAVYLLVGYLFFLPIVGSEPIRWRLSYPIRLLMLAVAMPVDTFTGLILSMQSSPVQATTGPAPPGSPAPLQDVHWAGAIMWVGGDALMFGFMMLTYLMWARSDRGGASSLGWLEKVRSNSFDTLVTPASRAAAEPAGAAPGAAAVATPAEATPAGTVRPAAAARPAGAAGGHGTIDDDEHLAAYNDYLARLNQSGHGPAGGQN
ncbi:MAG: cytochrome c oxidase assembly protein [Streptosporangiaceae bacterium]